MNIESFDILFYTFAFIVPGFILDSVISRFVPQKEIHIQILFLRFLSFSCFNYAIWSWLIYLLIQKEFFIESYYVAAILWFMIIFISPILLGLLLGFFNQKSTIRKALHFVGLNLIHTIPTAWDYRFWNIRKGCVWVLVTLQDESQVAGLFGSSSFAASNHAGGDLYLQEVFKIVEDGVWKEVPNSDGILLKSDQIKYIEFWKDLEE